jgi:lantibiotic modifying enzyme
MSWQPLLTGDSARRAVDAARRIAVELEAQYPPTAGPCRPQSGGPSGLALLHGYLATTGAEERELAEERAGLRLDHIITESGERRLPASFWSGFTGIAWTNLHLEELLVGEARADLNEEVDSMLREIVRLTPWRWQYDLIAGLVGIGCYALDHPNRNLAADLLASIVERLVESSIERDGGITWWTPPTLLGVRAAARYPQGYFDLGLAHGIPGIVALLGRACASGLVGGDALRLLEGAIHWLLANRRSDDGGPVFGRYAGDLREFPARSAWCYGDPGVAIALLTAAQAVGEAKWEREALAIAFRACARPMDETGVVDACFCHGTSGLGHLYNRMYQATGEERFARAAADWFQQTLRRWDRHGNEPATWLETAEDWWQQAELLEGGTGAGLALLAAASSVEPGWDRPLLASLNEAVGGEARTRNQDLRGS